MPFANQILGGQNKLIRPAIQSPNFVHGSAGWSINKDGSAEFNNLTLRGTFAGFDYVIDSSGAFFYSGTPALGNLVLSAAQTAGTDEFGNPYKQGFTAYISGYAASLWSDTGSGFSGLIFHQSLSSTLTLAPQLFASTFNAGAANEYVITVLTSGKESGLDDAAVQLFSESADATGPAKVVFEFGGQVSAYVTRAGGVVANQPGTPSTPETWHNITLDAGWTAGTQVPQYKLLPDGNIQTRGQCTHASVTATTAINSSTPVPSAYRPAVTRFYRAADPTDTAGLVQIDTTGVFSVRANATFPATQALMDGTYSI